MTISQGESIGLSPSSQTCLSNIQTHIASLKYPDFSAYPQNKLAAVLVLLFEQNGALRVLLTTRSKELRTHAGQTALPGGKKDPSDTDMIAAALREANEEVSLPVGSPYVHIIGELEPFISLHKLLVTPVIAYLSSPRSVLSSLVASECEVSQIFSHPLEAILNPKLVTEQLVDEQLVEMGSENWIYETELHSTSDSKVPMLGGSLYRMHRFRSSASPVKGLTADILIKVAGIAYRSPTIYERYAPGQLRNIEDIVAAVEDNSDKGAP
ncbi:NUDIX hydrolase domain-like protein [Crepidotus variabilis]|uniref:NUDIX hydrolase domain-like protein n=1 Tax=Crepidotus variabilis TaxID=179855 RepID=A0A9P6JMJ2_9AGAR|nr:NUDIX hydrolase domain-like protein [Crepidotus variabilis]